MKREQIIEEIKTLFEKMSVPVSDIETETQGEMSVYNIVTPESRMVIGRGGEHLRALNYIVSLMLSRKHDAHVRLNFDVNNYRKNELDKMRVEVRSVADKVLRSKIDQELQPMSSYERLVVHNLLTDEVQIETHSVGEGKDRRIIIKYSEV